MFVGTRDKTLLAVGVLSGGSGVMKTANADGSSVPDKGGYYVRDIATTLNFRLIALEAGVEMPANPANPSVTAACSFLTANGDPSKTDINAGNTTVGIVTTATGNTFPMFKVDYGVAAIPATYTLGVAGSTDSGDLYAINTFEDLLPSIANGRPIVEMRNPRYLYQGSYRDVSSQLSSKTTVTLTNYHDSNFKLVNPIEMNIATNQPGNTHGLTSFTFAIPVHAITGSLGYTTVYWDPWYIRPGIGPNAYDLDDGTKGLGGAILLAVGNISDDSSLGVTTTQQ
jgi:hypothetical protein